MSLEPYATLITGVLVPAGIVLGAKRALFSNLHLSIVVFSIIPVIAMSFLMLDHESALRRYASMLAFLAVYYSLSYAGAWCFARVERRRKS